MYKFIPQDKQYEIFQVVDTKTLQPVEMFDNVKMAKSKLFSNDIFDFENNTFTIVSSHVRNLNDIPGVLNIRVTHGRYKDKFLYVCKPDDKRLPSFLIPYKKPYNFDKSTKHIYITFTFDNWDNDLPKGSMKQNFGSIEVLDNYYEYILYCKSLNASIQKFTKTTKTKLENTSSEQVIRNISENYNLEYVSKKDEFIFTLDASSSNDHDDALSYNENERKTTIYITNVALIVDYLELWNSFTKRISTMYLPDKRRTMLPTVLNECLLSLNEKKDKICYALEIFYDKDDKIISHRVKICKVYISKNYSHEEDIDNFSRNKCYNRLISLFNAEGSKDLVTKSMIYFNTYIAHYLCDTNMGVYRNITPILCDNSENKETLKLPKNVYEHMRRIKTNASKYSLHQDVEEDTQLYLQASSPIRRLVDILNNIAILNAVKDKEKIELNEMNCFYDSWTSDQQLDYINMSSRSIRKVQSKCHIYSQYISNKEMNISQIYTGYVFDKIIKYDGKYQYMVYIPSINLTTYATFSEDFENYTSHDFNLFVFMNQEQDKNKIKLHLVPS